MTTRVEGGGAGIPVTDEIQGNLNIRNYSGLSDSGNLLVEGNLTVDGSVNFTAPTSGLGLKQMVGGGVITTADIATAIAAGFTGMFLDPAAVWTMSGVVFDNVKNFVIESRMSGSIGWLGQVQYNTAGYIATGSGQDGIQIYSSSPNAAPTQGIVFKNCVLVGSNTRAVVHLGGGERQCGFIDTLVYNTASSAGAYAVVTGSALSDNNSENLVFSFSGGGGLAGNYAALGIGVADQTQRANDTLYVDLKTHGGTYSIRKDAGGNHTFLNYYDRSSPTTATVYNHGGARMIFIGGEDQNTTGQSHLIDASTAITLLVSRMITKAGSQTTTISMTDGALILRGTCVFNGAQTVSLTSPASIDLADPAINASNMTLSGTGVMLITGSYSVAGSVPILTSWNSPVQLLSPIIVAGNRGSGETTTKTVTWSVPNDGQNHRFRVAVMIRPTVAGTSTVPSISFTQSGGAVINQTIPMWKLDGAATAPDYLCNATGTFLGSIESDTNTAGVNVVVTITRTGSTYDYSVEITQLS